MAICMLTTIDNEYDPIDHYDQWYDRDQELGYDCCGYLARVALTSDEFTDEENDAIVEQAIDEILEYDFAHIYKKVKR